MTESKLSATPKHTDRDEIDRAVHARDGRTIGHTLGGKRPCALEGCRGMRMSVRWPDGKLTYPCTDGMSWDGEAWWIR